MTKRQTQHGQQLPPADTDIPSYRPPQQLLDHCPDCDGMVLLGVAKAGGVIAWQEPPLNPLGGVHECATAFSWTLTVHGLRWNTVRIAPQQTLHAGKEGMLFSSGMSIDMVGREHLSDDSEANKT